MRDPRQCSRLRRCRDRHRSCRGSRIGPSARVDGIVADCRDLLGIATEVETYVYPEPTFNAACLKPQHGRVMVLLSSSLLEAFDEPELRFVVGHELGHHLFDTTASPSTRC